MLRKISLFVGILAISMPAAGQTTDAPKSSTGSTTRERPASLPPVSMTPEAVGAAVMRQGGGSLLQAGRIAGNIPGSATAPGAQPLQDITKSAVRAYSPFAVPEPEPKLVKKHDLITIIVREESEATSTGTSDLKRESTLDAEATDMVRFDLANAALVPAIGAGGVTPKINMTGNRTFKGEGTAKRTDSFVTRIQAEVIDVKPNGTLVLQARKKIKNDEEEQTFVCAGICRVEDITPDNSVLSTQLFDLEVSKQSKGQVRNSTKTGVLHKLLDFLNLF